MTSTIIERTRLLHQDITQHESTLLDTLLIPTTNLKDRLLQEHTTATELSNLLTLEKQLLSLYQDKDGVRSRELSYISGDQSFSAFYNEIQQLRDYFMSKAQHVVKDNTAKKEGEDVEGTKDVPWKESTVTSLFSAEESFGRHVDMHLLFETYINLPQFKHIDYITYLKTFDRLDLISKDSKLKSHQSEAYRKHIDDVVNYLSNFHARLHPLVKIEVLEKMMNEEFDKLWEEKKVKGWFDVAGEVKSSEAGETAPATTTSTENKDQENNPLYCKACAKLFAKDSVFTAHLSGRAHKKAALALSTGDPKRESQSRSLANLEFRLQQWAELLRGILSDTIAHITEKQTKTYEEMIAEEERAVAAEQAKVAAADEDSDEDDDKPIYNPLNLPLGWDGKPIPFWLYKLHGLNIEYVCEICGNHSYYGPRNFERHFKEWRHAFGMRCLGIPNSKHFINVTKMDQAKALYEKLKKENATSGFKPDEEEEFEDSEGNVFNKKTYQDLQRQGLI